MDLTPLFRQIVDVVDEIKPSSASDFPKNPESLIINDTFIKECGLFDDVIGNLNQFVDTVKPTYLDIDAFSTDEKVQVDQEFSLEIQKMYKKLKHLQEYESKREKVAAGSTRGGVLSRFLNDVSEKELWLSSVATHRTMILKYLHYRLNQVGKKFDTIQRKRLQRERQLNLLNFQNIEEEELAVNNQQYAALIEEEEARAGLAPPQLSQQQMVQLETENKELLQLKSQQLKSVEQLHTSMVDIVNLQAELTFQLETQADQIDNLLDSQSQVSMDIASGNKEMKSATRRNKRAANLLVMSIYCIGILILVVDFLKFI